MASLVSLPLEVELTAPC